jgi:hypothetical protein
MKYFAMMGQILFHKFEIFREKMILHKTFHRYVVRAKRGTAQGTRDSQGNAPKSAGASIRRYNETALKEVCGFKQGIV